MSNNSCGVIVLAAGMARRMGCPKLLLPWQGRTIIRAIVDILEKVDFTERIIVLGDHHDQIEQQISNTTFSPVYNPDYVDGDMLRSIQCGVRALNRSTNSVMIVLGDQPNLSEEIITRVIWAARETDKLIVIPSYKMKRGHPWLIKRTLFMDILSIQSPLTLRDLIRKHEKDIEYVLSEDANILSDIDTPEDYQRLMNDQDSGNKL